MENKQTYHIPPSYRERSELRRRIDICRKDWAVQPPLSVADLSCFADRLIGEYALDAGIKEWLMVEIHNRVWCETVASIPFDRRLLLLPKCLSHSAKCQAEIDELGLLCHRCGQCRIPDLQETAERLGMMSLVAEGFTSVVELIRNRVVDAVIGVSCLDSLEKAFPLLISHAVPGLAIPLNTSGCKDTQVDNEYVVEMMSMHTGKEVYLLDYEALRADLQQWFSRENLSRHLSPATNQTSEIALEWMSGDGKRWRPYLLAAVYLALTGKSEVPEEVQRAAIAVECFHKASLVHDDIQDNDRERYGKPTVNAQYGVPIAINIGDVLLGEGYRLLARCGSAELVAAAADAHIALCKGQGMELGWSASPGALSMDFVLGIFCDKTVPAFEVSLLLGLICAGGDEALRTTFHAYARALGIAYQLLDDVEDFQDDRLTNLSTVGQHIPSTVGQHIPSTVGQHVPSASGQVIPPTGGQAIPPMQSNDRPLALRPSAVLAVLCEQHPEPAFIDALLQEEDLKAFLYLPENRPHLQQALDEVKKMAETYHQQALSFLREITNVELKRLLFRVTERILH